MRRTHLYLTLLLLPWFLMYGLTSLAFNHNKLFDTLFDHGQSDWIDRFEIDYHEAPPADDEELRQWAARAMAHTGLGGSFGVHRPNDKRVNIWIYSFWSSTQVSYEEGVLTGRDRRFRWDHAMTGMHARGGFHQQRILDDGWSFMVDLVCLGMLLWIITGFYMWWTTYSRRFWGWLAVSAGGLAFLIFLIGL